MSDNSPVLPQGGSYHWSVSPLLNHAMTEGQELSRAFITWSQEGRDLFHFGDAPPEVVEILEANSSTVVMSPVTYAKQVQRHGELDLDLYGILPRALLLGEVYNIGPRKVQFILEIDDFGFEATVKCTSCGELFLVSFFRAKKARVKKTRERYPRVK